MSASRPPTSDFDDAIAIIGMAGRFPGAQDTDAFWKNLCNGVESISTFANDELEDNFPDDIRTANNFVRARPVLDGIEYFDAEFFGVYTKEAELMDPQHRLFLESAWHALEDGGYDAAKYSGNIGVFAGCSANTYFLRNVCQQLGTIEKFTDEYQVGNYAMLTGAGQDFLATRVSYKLNLRGPSITVQSACSTSLLAVAQACQSLLLYQSDLALAGGVSITLPQKRGYISQEGGMVSADGHCRSFDAAASGTVFGSGLGIVLLKRANEALRDGDHIYAIVRGCGVNNDGATKVGFTAPSVSGQAAAIEMAIANAAVDARSISYIECHGTATPLGDPIEIAGLTQAFRMHTTDTAFCAIGSVKTNVGHLDVAAGVTGLIKTALSLQHQQLPTTLHFKNANPTIDFAHSPFYVNDRLRAWPSASPRRAGVSAFGVGGTNVHVVLEEAPPMIARSSPNEAPYIVVISAKTQAALQAMCGNLANHIAVHTQLDLADVAFTLQAGRRAFEHRFATVVKDRDVLLNRLSMENVAGNSPTTFAGSPLSNEPNVVFMFPGQGAQYPNMARDLYDTEPVFRREFDICAELLQPNIARDIRDVLFAQVDDGHAAEVLQATSFAQPALFCVEYSLARLWMHWGIQPQHMIGHSVGEFVAAVLSGVMSLDDGLSLVAARGQLMQSLPCGAMLAVRAGEKQVADVLASMSRASLALAAINSASHCVVSGSDEDIAACEAVLTSKELVSRRLHTSHAFHSPMMSPMLDPFLKLVQRVRLSPPQLPFASCVSGAMISDAQATSAEYWAQHARAPVRFAAGLETLSQLGANAFVEVGPGSTLATFARQILRDKEFVVTTSLPSAQSDVSDRMQVRTAIAQLWIKGVEPHWKALYRGSPRRVSLPRYPFERRRYWIDVLNSAARQTPVTQATETKSIATGSIATPNEASTETATVATTTSIAAQLCVIFEELAGERRVEPGSRHTFLELGFDSLFLTQVAQHVERQFKTKITFRQLLGNLNSIPLLVAHLEANGKLTAGTASPLEVTELRALSEDSQKDSASRFQVYSNRQRSAQNEISAVQRAHLQTLIEHYCARTQGSKRYTQTHRKHLADPRAAAGFRSEWKEMVYPIVMSRAAGSKIWDVDGNEYIDLVSGYGQTAFGHAPTFVIDAVQAQLTQGFAIGPQAELAGVVANLICELTGNERAAFCNTGSEAVMAAMRIARAVTGRDKVVVFEGAYHGQFDEVLVHSTQRDAAEPKSVPVAAGIPRSSVQNMVVLDYASPAALQWIRNHASDIAAVIVEPVQSRRPQLQPVEFLRELRELTRANDIAFVMDEVVTGFRVHPGGMQAVFDIRADLVTYGKVIGGGLPIGIVAGCAKFMDALDGGQWQYGDDSVPEVGVTFFAGTFVRHPLALAAAHAVLKHLQRSGAQLQVELNTRTTKLVDELNEAFATVGIRSRIHCYASWFYFNVGQESALANLLFYHLRLRGIHVQDGFPCFITTAHSDADLQRVSQAFRESLAALRAADCLGQTPCLEESARPATVATLPKRVPLTESQTEIWLAAQQSDDASCAFNESITLHMRGDLDLAALQAALNTIVMRHDAFRAAFTVTGEEMIVAVTGSLPINRVDYAGDADSALKDFIDRDARQPFDLLKGPLIRASLLKFDAQSQALILTAHHLVCDGWSFSVLLDELRELYAAHCRSKPVSLPQAMQFSDYAMSLARGATETQTTEEFWLSQFDLGVAALDLPTDRQRAALKSYDGARITRTLGAALYQRIKVAGASCGATLFATLLSSFQVLLGRLAGQNDVTVGVPFAGQALLDNEILVGHAVNFLPMRAQWDANTTVAEALATASKHALDARDHQNFTLGTLVRKLSNKLSNKLSSASFVSCQANRLPIVEVEFNLERLVKTLSLPGLQVAISPNQKRRVVFDWALNITESANGLRLDCSYKTQLFDAATIEHWLQCYQAQLEAWATDVTQPLLKANYIPHAMRDRLLVELNATHALFPQTTTLDNLLGMQARDRPDSIAVECRDESLTFSQLHARVETLARFIASVVTANHSAPRIGICIPRSIDMLVAMLATWRAGCVYVPLDPSNPAARLRHILSDAEVSVLLTFDASSVEFVPSSVVVVDLKYPPAAVDANAASIASNNSRPMVSRSEVAYLIYTSGSTGLPKGVEITHRSVMNLLAAMSSSPGLAAGDTLLAVTTISFDIAVLELFLPLFVGARVVIATSDEVSNGDLLTQRIAAKSVNVLQATPATWRLLIEAGFKPKTKFKMLCGGEALSPDLAKQLLSLGGELWNMYGPTETTVWSSCAKIESSEPPIVVGKPIANTQFYILDAHDQLAPLGVPGQLHIGGEGVARGYFKREILNAEKFIANPFGPGNLYRTGDRARYLTNGEVILLGRIDQQVKLRGYRIELGEIESILQRHPAVQSAAVMLRENASNNDVAGDRGLVAYVVHRSQHQSGNDSAQSSAELRAHLSQYLPDYMIPTVWVNLKSLPLLSNGKLNRAALPSPASMPHAETSAKVFVAPRNPNEIALAKIVREVLKLSRLGVGDDILSLGADSLHLFQIVARANREGIRISAKQLLQQRTIEAVLRANEEKQSGSSAPAVALSLREFKRQRASRASEAVKS